MPHPTASVDPSLDAALATTTPPRSPSRSATPPKPSTTSTLRPLSPAATINSPRRKPTTGRQRALQLLRQLQTGGPLPPHCNHIWRFPVTPFEWPKLQDDVFNGSLQHWARDKLHWHWSASTDEVAIRMASPLHETFKEGLLHLIMGKIRRVKHGQIEKIEKTLERIRSAGSQTLTLSKRATRAPDISFSYEGCSRPPFVCEIAVSQSGEQEFPTIAEDYLLESKGLIRTFLGVDIEYRTPEQRGDAGERRWARYYLWRLQVDGERGSVGDCVGPVTFQDESGVLDPEATLSLRLCDFSPRRRIDLSQPTIEITHRELADIMALAEGVQKATDHPALTPEAATDSEDDILLPFTEPIWQHSNKRAASEEPADEVRTSPDLASSFDGSNIDIEKKTKRRANIPRGAKKTRVEVEVEVEVPSSGVAEENERVRRVGGGISIRSSIHAED